jgi:hypothetical protein
VTGIEVAAAAVAVTTVVAAGATTYSSYQQAKQQQAYAKYDSEAAKEQAESASQQAVAAERQQRTRSREFIARSIAATGEGGVDWTGSRAAVIGQSAADAEYDALLTRYAGRQEVSALRQQSSLAATRARAYGTVAPTALVTGAASALAAGASGYYGTAGAGRGTGTSGDPYR